MVDLSRQLKKKIIPRLSVSATPDNSVRTCRSGVSVTGREEGSSAYELVQRVPGRAPCAAQSSRSPLPSPPTARGGGGVGACAVAWVVPDRWRDVVKASAVIGGEAGREEVVVSTHLARMLVG